MDAHFAHLGAFKVHGGKLVEKKVAGRAFSRLAHFLHIRSNAEIFVEQLFHELKFQAGMLSEAELQEVMHLVKKHPEINEKEVREKLQEITQRLFMRDIWTTIAESAPSQTVAQIEPIAFAGLRAQTQAARIFATRQGKETTESDIEDFLRNTPYLRKIVFTGWHNVDGCVLLVVRYVPGVQKLDLSSVETENFSAIEALATFQQLELLYLEGRKITNKAALLRVVNGMGDHLRRLSLPDSDPPYTADEIRDLLRNLPFLEELRLPENVIVTTELLQDIIAHPFLKNARLNLNWPDQQLQIDDVKALYKKCSRLLVDMQTKEIDEGILGEDLQHFTAIQMPRGLGHGGWTYSLISTCLQATEYSGPIGFFILHAFKNQPDVRQWEKLHFYIPMVGSQVGMAFQCFVELDQWLRSQDHLEELHFTFYKASEEDLKLLKHEYTDPTDSANLYILWNHPEELPASLKRFIVEGGDKGIHLPDDVRFKRW